MKILSENTRNKFDTILTKQKEYSKTDIRDISDIDDEIIKTIQESIQKCLENSECFGKNFSLIDILNNILVRQTNIFYAVNERVSTIQDIEIESTKITTFHPQITFDDKFKEKMNAKIIQYIEKIHLLERAYYFALNYWEIIKPHLDSQKALNNNQD